MRMRNDEENDGERWMFEGAVNDAINSFAVDMTNQLVLCWTPAPGIRIWAVLIFQIFEEYLDTGKLSDLLKLLGCCDLTI